ncbi:hypothetical protein SAMN02745132_04799 [Enterovibrio nigricans DSM 22720]|uniref:Uncharacterized protein n=1 Tax=Enterovibrio nigricans DSM 22720 TaxID=1121868 RepID=A0A1T4W6W0_9GAMM|nr:hypothetical protein SAMN02745132_04799 [Enterovibrio nigricans DSM 22720]
MVHIFITCQSSHSSRTYTQIRRIETIITVKLINFTASQNGNLNRLRVFASIKNDGGELLAGIFRKINVIVVYLFQKTLHLVPLLDKLVIFHKAIQWDMKPFVQLAYHVDSQTALTFQHLGNTTARTQKLHHVFRL